ncbi:DUF2306 domain-containing protein [Brevundimonas sp.]|uniref:DUF2306 domain-containing protein n=1 Tax=Brevundimonas sp. TaxID=1871086 RepID=UPI00262EEEEA|nr:DUF2306 domain-containing protein [Brevundimonas sp.]
MSSHSSPAPIGGAAAGALRWAGILWFVVAAIGQAAFVGFILAFYGTRTVAGNYAGWNDKPLIDGYIAGDAVGNFVFAAHVLLASVVTFAGLMQLVPAIRRAVPALHRWTGRTFLIVAGFMALSGFWLTLVRGTSLSTVSSAAIVVDGVLILIFGGLAWQHAVKRRFDQHRLWAMRTFMAVSGVWFLRVGIMGWVLVNQGPVGMSNNLSGPADIVLVFGSYLIPLGLLELYFRAGRSAHAAPKLLTAALVLVAAVFTAIGVFGTIALMWGPYL